MNPIICSPHTIPANISPLSLFGSLLQIPPPSPTLATEPQHTYSTLGSPIDATPITPTPIPSTISFRSILLSPNPAVVTIGDAVVGNIDVATIGDAVVGNVDIDKAHNLCHRRHRHLHCRHHLRLCSRRFRTSFVALVTRR